MAACLCLTWEERQSQIPQQRCAWDSSWRRDPDKLRNRKNRASLSSHLEKQVLADPGSCFSLRSFCHPVLPGLHLQTLFLTGQCPPGCPGDCSPASTRLEVRLSPTPWKSGSISKLECKGPSPWVCRGAGERAWGVQLPGPFLSLLPALLTHFFFFFFGCPMFSFLLFFLLPWPQLTTNIIPGSNKVIRPNSGPCRARPSAALTAVSFLMLKLAL